MLEGAPVVLQTNDILPGMTKPLAEINMPHITSDILNISYNDVEIIQFSGRAPRGSLSHNLQDDD